MRTEHMGWNPNRDHRQAAEAERRQQVDSIVNSMRRPLRAQRRDTYRWNPVEGKWMEVR